MGARAAYRCESLHRLRRMRSAAYSAGQHDLMTAGADRSVRADARGLSWHRERMVRSASGRAPSNAHAAYE